jgi:hypothetical protein
MAPTKEVTMMSTVSMHRVAGNEYGAVEGFPPAEFTWKNYLALEERFTALQFAVYPVLVLRAHASPGTTIAERLGFAVPLIEHACAALEAAGLLTRGPTRG